ncbi:lipopolysaccharide heptosyltransferase family protein [bacterium]|nr:lipopolysaccharide heptosyltransferase family protein [bacterium]
MALVRRMRQLNADLFIGLWEKPRFGWASVVAGIRYRVGYRIGLLGRFLWTRSVPIQFSDWRLHQMDHNRNVIACAAGSFGRVVSPQPMALIPPDCDRRRQLPDIYFAVHLDASNPGKTIQPLQMIAVIEGVLTRGHHCVLIGLQRPWVQAVRDHFETDVRVTDWCGLLNLPEMASIIRDAHGYIGPDSGPGHMAAALNQRGVIYYINRDQNPLRWMPWASAMVPIRNPGPQLLVSCFWEMVDQCKSSSSINRERAARATITIGRIGGIGSEWEPILKDVAVHQLLMEREVGRFARSMVEYNINVVIGMSHGWREWLKLQWALIYAANHNHFKPMRYVGTPDQFWSWAVNQKTQS